jgi:hypothetical protein
MYYVQKKHLCICNRLRHGSGAFPNATRAWEGGKHGKGGVGQADAGGGSACANAGGAGTPAKGSAVGANMGEGAMPEM